MAGSLDVRVVTAAEIGQAEMIEAFLEGCATSFAQQTIAWRDVIAPIGPDESLFLVCRCAGQIIGVLPAYRFDGPLGAILTSAPGAGPLGGVACCPDDGVDAYEALLAAFIKLAQERDCADKNPTLPRDSSSKDAQL